MTNSSFSHMVDAPQYRSGGRPSDETALPPPASRPANAYGDGQFVPPPAPPLFSHARPPAANTSHPATGPVGPASISSSSPEGNQPSVTSSASTRPNRPPPSSSTAAPPPGRDGNLFACRDCGRSYSRPEHLVRHVQSHTLGRRFACEVCGKAFARKDLMRRHLANHSNDSTKKRRNTSAAPTEGRVSYACKACASARVKCDDVKPCKRCVGKNLQCEFSETGSAAAMHAAHVPDTARTYTSDPDHGQPSSSSPEKTDSTSSPASIGQPVVHPTGLRETLANGRNERVREPQVADWLLATGQYDNHHSRAPIEQYHGPGADRGPMAGDQRANLSGFLRDVLFTNPSAPAREDTFPDVTMLDFCGDTDLDINDHDYGILEDWYTDKSNAEGGSSLEEYQAAEPASGISKMREGLSRIWIDSPWLWNPQNHDNGYAEHAHLPVPLRATSSVEFAKSVEGIEMMTADKLNSINRNKILAVVLRTCRRPDEMAHRIAASFPSTEVMDTLIHLFLKSHMCQTAQWMHLPSLALNDQCAEWLGMAAAMGGVLSPVNALRKFGYALQGAIRLSIPTLFEENNTNIQDPGLVQALFLVQELALWSGNRRKMEIAECHLPIPITMMRYRGKFRASSYPAVVVHPSDEGYVLEEKWKAWAGREQWKRLVFGCYICDAQVSMTTLTNPSMSYAELTLPLPDAKALWLAKTAEEWKELYLTKEAGQSQPKPSVGDLFHDVRNLTTNHARLDTRFCIYIFLHASWALILEYRQLSTVNRTRSYVNTIDSTPNVVLGSRYSELVRDLQSFYRLVCEWKEMSAQEHVLANLLLMNLHVSVEDLQLFSGKEGEERARQVHPMLVQWTESTEARSAMWSAGQILRYAKLLQPGQLKSFSALSVYHAALALWTFSVVTRACHGRGFHYGSEVIHLDGPESLAVQRYVSLGQGRPVVSGPGSGKTCTEASLGSPEKCMEIAHDVLLANHDNDAKSMPQLVVNLAQLIKQLGNAATDVGLV